MVTEDVFGNALKKLYDTGSNDATKKMYFREPGSQYGLSNLLGDIITLDFKGGMQNIKDPGAAVNIISDLISGGGGYKKSYDNYGSVFGNLLGATSGILGNVSDRAAYKQEYDAFDKQKQAYKDLLGSDYAGLADSVYSYDQIDKLREFARSLEKEGRKSDFTEGLNLQGQGFNMQQPSNVPVHYKQEPAPAGSMVQNGIADLSENTSLAGNVVTDGNTGNGIFGNFSNPAFIRGAEMNPNTNPQAFNTFQSGIKTREEIPFIAREKEAKIAKDLEDTNYKKKQTEYYPQYIQSVQDYRKAMSELSKDKFDYTQSEDATEQSLNQELSEDLGTYSSLVSSRSKEAERFRQLFIGRYGKDPLSLIKDI